MITKEYLVREYLENDRTMLDIANELGVTKSKLYYYIKKFGLTHTEDKKHIVRGIDDSAVSEDNIDIAYLAGLLATDGFVGRKNLMTLTLSGEWVPIYMRELASRIGYKGEIANREKHGGFSDKPFYEMTICSENLYNFLIERYNIVGKKEDGLDRFPLDLLDMDEEVQKSFILGIFDGDGTLDVERGRYQITSGNERFIINIKEFINRKFEMDIEVKYRGDREGNYPFLLIPRAYSYILSNWMYSSNCLKIPYKLEKHNKCFYH